VIERTRATMVMTSSSAMSPSSSTAIMFDLNSGIYDGWRIVDVR
jgi:hypothetical protein